MRQKYLQNGFSDLFLSLGFYRPKRTFGSFLRREIVKNAFWTIKPVRPKYPQNGFSDLFLSHGFYRPKRTFGSFRRREIVKNAFWTIKPVRQKYHQNRFSDLFLSHGFYSPKHTFGSSRECLIESVIQAFLKRQTQEKPFLLRHPAALITWRRLPQPALSASTR